MTEKKSKDGSNKTRKKWEKEFSEAMAVLEKADLERLKTLKSTLAHAATAVIETATADREVRRPCGTQAVLLQPRDTLTPIRANLSFHGGIMGPVHDDSARAV